MTEETKLERHLRSRLEGGSKLFVVFLTVGLPSSQSFIRLVSDLDGVCDTLEVGIPFSDPIMDGPIIQEASTRALQSGVSVSGSLRLIAEATKHTTVPIVAYTYYNPIYRMGLSQFVKTAHDAGVMGLIVPDLPYEESREIDAHLKAQDIAHVQLIAPATSEKRAAMLAKSSEGFVYAVSRLGVTGERESLAASAKEVVERIRPHTGLPVLLGVGISNAAQARAAAEVSDGVIVGSAILKRVLADDVSGAVSFAKELRSALS